VRYENGALLSVIDGLGYPDAGAGSNDQCLVMYFEGEGRTGLLEHDDQFRGVVHCYLDPIGVGGSQYNYVSPDFFRFVPWTGGPGAMPVGYGPDSVAATILKIAEIEGEVAGLDGAASLARRQEMIRQTNAQGIIATPANSSLNELVTEAARLSIVNDGAWVRIMHGEAPRVELR